MDAPKTLITKVYRHFMHDSLYRNSIFLMLDTAILAVFGFIFWAIAAQNYSVHDVGITATLISAAGLMTLLSALGFDSTLIRYLANYKEANKLINTAFTVTGITAFIIASLYLLIVSLSTNNLSFMHESLLYYVPFIAFMVVNLWNNISNNVFIAFRKTHYVLLVNLGFSMLRLTLLILLATFGLNGILTSQFAGIATSLLLTFIVLRRVFKYKYKLLIDLGVLQEFKYYASNSYISNTLANVPNLLMPTILFITLGPNFAAYYYIVNTIASSLNIIPSATAQSMFAEGSLDTKNLKTYVIRSFKIVSYTLIPSVIILSCVGNYILNFFGSEYAKNGNILLLLITISMLPRAVNYILSTVLRIKHKLRQLSAIYAVYTFIILFGAYITLRHKENFAYLGLVIIIAEVVTTIYLMCLVIKSRTLALTCK